MDKLAAYKLDRAFTEGVEITLDAAPEVVFLVKLPSQYFREYTQALYGSIDFELSEDGKVKPGRLMDSKFAQEDAFVKHCLVSMDGEPLPDDFASRWPAALTELIEKAQEMSNAIEEKVADTKKKSLNISSGNGDGQAKRSSTESLKSAAG